MIGAFGTAYRCDVRRGGTKERGACILVAVDAISGAVLHRPLRKKRSELGGQMRFDRIEIKLALAAARGKQLLVASTGLIKIR